MKTLTKIALLMLSSAVYGQDITGEWSGSLHVQGNQIRLVLHVNKTNDTYEATLDSPDQNTNDIVVTSVKVNFATVTVVISGIDAIFEGILADGKITGNWMQAGTFLFLTLSQHDGQLQEK